MQFGGFPHLSAPQCSKTSFKTEVCSCCGYPSEAVLWIREVEMVVVESVDDLKTSQPSGERRFLDFEMLDAKIVSVLKNVIMNSYFKKRDQSGGSKGPNGRPISQWKTDCVHDLRILPGDWCS